MFKLKFGNKKEELKKTVDLEGAKTISMTAEGFLDMVDSGVILAEQSIKVDILNDVMNLLDGMIEKTTDNKIKHGLKMAKLRIYEDNFRENKK